MSQGFPRYDATQAEFFKIFIVENLSASYK